jgi:hypothetical protein
MLDGGNATRREIVIELKARQFPPSAGAASLWPPAKAAKAWLRRHDTEIRSHSWAVTGIV